MNVELSIVALKLLNDLTRTGLYGVTSEDTARQFIEEKLQELVREGFLTLPNRQRQEGAK